MESIPLLDRAGRRRSPATTSSFHQGLPPRNKGLRYPADPPTVEEIIAVMRAAGDGPDGVRLRGVIVVLWRAGLRISEALALNESDLDRDRGAMLIRHGKGGQAPRGRDGPLGMAAAEPWLELRTALPVGALFCVLRGPTARPPVRAGRHPRTAAPRRRRGRRPSPVRAASAAARSRGRDVARGDLADRHPAPARSRRPRDHLAIPARDRQHRDHPSRPPATRTDDPGRSATPVRTLTAGGSRRGQRVLRPRTCRGLARPLGSKNGNWAAAHRREAPAIQGRPCARPVRGCPDDESTRRRLARFPRK